MGKAFHKDILHILIAEMLLKDAYLVAKDNAELISKAAIKEFASSFVKLGNINFIKYVRKVILGSGYKIDEELFQMVVSRYIV
uniref:MI domain-containing protein n=1 Tax=Salix viminalis TaxID=40686 RepID=A0A6N2LKL2_SALVM